MKFGHNSSDLPSYQNLHFSSGFQTMTTARPLTVLIFSTGNRWTYSQCNAVS